MNGTFTQPTPPQFTLRRLFLLVAVCCGLLAIFQGGLIPGAMICVSLLLIGVAKWTVRLGDTERVLRMTFVSFALFIVSVVLLYLAAGLLLAAIMVGLAS